MNKYIEKVENYKSKVLGARLEKLRKEYKEAKDCLRDTGHDRYFNKMGRRENEINEIEKYLEKFEDTPPKTVTTEEYRELLKLRKQMKLIASKVFCLAEYMPLTDDMTSLMELLREYKYD